MIDQAESAIAENGDPKTALIFLHRLLDTAGIAAYYAMFSAPSPDKRIALANIRDEVHERGGQVLGFIQQLVSGKGKEL